MEAGAITYAEVRRFARWLETFSATDLAGVLGCPRELGERFVRALLWHGICIETAEELDYGSGPEPVILYVPLPPGPREHLTLAPPEVATPGVYSEAPRRGMPVAMRNGRTRESGVGRWRPGRSQGPGKKKGDPSKVRPEG